MFKIGDRVEIQNYLAFEGLVGTIVSGSNEDYFRVHLDKPVSFASGPDVEFVYLDESEMRPLAPTWNVDKPVPGDKPMPVAYISGPIANAGSGWEEPFNRVAVKLKADGWKVYNPAEWEVPGKPVEQYMIEDIPRVLDAGTIFMLPGWQDSKGARLEYAVAKATNRQIVFADGASAAEPLETVAQELVRSGEREAQYGHPGDDFIRTAAMWAGYKGIPFTPQDVALMMALLKISRLAADARHRDSNVDLIGYAICLERVNERLAA